MSRSVRFALTGEGVMSGWDLKQRRVFDAAAARYRALLSRTRDPGRRQMLEDMIAREVAAAQQFELASSKVRADETTNVVRIEEQGGRISR